jgi:hypothetical protein
MRQKLSPFTTHSKKGFVSQDLPYITGNKILVSQHFVNRLGGKGFIYTGGDNLDYAQGLKTPTEETPSYLDLDMVLKTLFDEIEQLKIQNALLAECLAIRGIEIVANKAIYHPIGKTENTLPAFSRYVKSEK